MTAAARVQRWTAGVEKGIGRALEKGARARPLALELEGAPFLATFERQARTYAARAQTLAAQGDRPGAVIQATHAARAMENHARVTAAIDSTLTPC